MSYEKQTWTNNVSTVDETKMNHIEGGIYGNSVDIKSMYDSLFFKPGETYSFEEIICAGHLTTSNTKIDFTLPVKKRLDNVIIDNFSITGYIRHADGGYILNDADITSIGNVTFSNYNGNFVRGRIELNSPSSFQNNSVVTVGIRGTITFEDPSAISA